MVGRSPIDLLIYESKRRPEVRALMELAESGMLTDEELNAAKVPLPWYRKALRQLRDARLRDARLNVSMNNTLNAMGAFIKDGTLAPSKGVMMVYTGPTRFISMGSSHIELVSGRPVFFPRIGGVWIDTVFSRRIDPVLENEVSRPIECDRLVYINTWKNIIARSIENRNDVEQIGEEMTNNSGNVPTALARLGVRFS